MGVFYKAVLRGSCQGQAITNILFYGDDAGDLLPVWTEATAIDIANTLQEELPGTFTDPLPLSYSLVDVVVSGVDERGNTVSDYEITRPINAPGDQDELPDGVDNYAVLAFQTEKNSSAGRNVKRSYIAYGPILPSWMNATGVLTAGFATAIVPVLALLLGNIVGSVGEYAPVRVSRTVAPALTGYGKVNAVTLRPYKSNRKSRRVRPTGP